MKMELALLLVTGFVVMNIYHDNKYIEMMKGWKKYYQMGGVIFLAISLYLFIKKNPTESNHMAKHFAGMIKHMPIERNSKDLFTPLFNIGMSNESIYSSSHPMNTSPQHKRMLNSGSSSNNRCVSGTKKKYVAARQSWKCANCSEQLNAWFDVDHKISLEKGGSNHVDNLEAVCKNCHGQKTFMESMI
tara:strand:- start:7 stop:570 length:564 start_codon:yes stop_codon:yes gene_type:complete